ncbi:hypothetical protein Trihar35433_7159 [Trichoderma harzianum]|nr:hypothetical protein Trihar35433_7159 [Trichoderma harzianum]
MEDQAAKELASGLNEQQMQQLLHLNEYSILGRLLDLTKKNPSPVFRLLEINERAAKEPVSDYVSDPCKRINCFRRLQDNIKRHELPLTPTMTVFALFMVAPIDVLQYRLDNLERNAQEKNTTEVQNFIEQCRTAAAVIQEFVSREGRQVEDTGEDNLFLLQSMNLCKRRDLRRCRISGMEDPEAVPIFPITMNSVNFLSMLETFWGTETATRLSTLILDPNFLRSPQNMLSLNRQLSWWFQGGKVAFKPLRKTNCSSLAVQVHWLKKSELEPTQLFTDDMSLCRVADSAGITYGCAGKEGWGRCVTPYYGGLGMETGHIHGLVENYGIEPPSFELLQLSWDLLRVAAICGATQPVFCSDEVTEDNNDYYDDDVDYGDDHFDDDYDEDEMESQPDMYMDKNYAQLLRWAGEIEGQEVGEQEVGGQEVEGKKVEGQEVEGQEVEGLEDLPIEECTLQ